MRQWQSRCPNLHVHVVLSEQPGADNGRRGGMVTDAVRVDFRSLAGFQAYLAGPPAMVDAATEVLREKGLGKADSRFMERARVAVSFAP